MRRYLIFLICVFLIILMVINVNAEDITGDSVTGEASQEVGMNISVTASNVAPILGDINSSIYVCEGDFLDYAFSITDVDEDYVTVDISPKDPFFVYPTSFDGVIYMNSNIISGILDKDDVGGIDNGFKVYTETISAFDGEYVDTKNTDITVIEINNEPVIEKIGVQTIEVWTIGDNLTFYHETQVNDLEDGDQDSGNLDFSISFSGDELFTISFNGVMNFTADDSTPLGVYNISVCVNDTGIDNPHSNIFSECGQDGGSITVCQNFSLTVTDRNRPPTIVDYYPEDLNLNIGGTDNLYFNVTEYDPDQTVPDAYWYINNVFKEYDAGSLVDEFIFSFGCGVSGKKNIKAEITDGLLNDSVTWNVNVSFVPCPVTSPSGGGGGGTACKQKWICNTWAVCQNAEKSLDTGILSGNDYRIIKDQCILDDLDEKTCGFQIRNCIDLNDCGITFTKPEEIQSCYYTEMPSCNDGIKNCHDGSCELLVDCGGPCLACPTCSDGIKNQEEEGIDCGGPCPWKCDEDKLSGFASIVSRLNLFPNTLFLYLLLFILFVLVVIVTIKIRSIHKIRKSLVK